MAWFYNHVLPRFFEIGLVASSRRLYNPAAGYVPKFAFFLRNSQISKFPRLAKRQKPHFGAFLGSKKDNVACSCTASLLYRLCFDV
jgi:hypothetical protein